MRITIGPGDPGGCGWYRLLLPFGMLAKERGYEVVCAHSSAIRELEDADVTIFQRVTTEHVVERMREIAGMESRPRLLMEVDDNLYCVPSTNPSYTIVGTGRPATKLFEKAARLCDGLIVSTDELANVYAKLNANIAVCPNALDDLSFTEYCRRLPATTQPKRFGQIRIGYAGTSSHLGDVMTVVPALSRVLKNDKRVRLVFFGDDLRPLFDSALWPQIEAHKGISATPQQNANPGTNMDAIIPKYYWKLASLDFDIALAPLQRHVFNAGKSNLKVLEMGMAGAAVVATNYGPYAKYAQYHPGSIVALPADDESRWVRELEALIADGDRRAALVEENRKTIARWYTISNTLDIWERTVQAYSAVAA